MGWGSAVPALTAWYVLGWYGMQYALTVVVKGWYGMVWNAVWHGMVWYETVRNGTVGWKWHGMVCYSTCTDCCC